MNNNKKLTLKGNKKIIRCLAAIVAFSTANSLILPAITIDQETAEEDPGIVLTEDENVNAETTYTETEDTVQEDSKPEPVEEGVVEATPEPVQEEPVQVTEETITEETVPAETKQEEVTDTQENVQELLPVAGELSYESKEDYVFKTEYDETLGLTENAQTEIKEVLKEDDYISYLESLKGQIDKKLEEDNIDKEYEFAYARFFNVYFLDNNAYKEVKGKTENTYTFNEPYELEDNEELKVFYIDKEGKYQEYNEEDNKFTFKYKEKENEEDNDKVEEIFFEDKEGIDNFTLVVIRTIEEETTEQEEQIEEEKTENTEEPVIEEQTEEIIETEPSEVTEEETENPEEIQNEETYASGSFVEKGKGYIIALNYSEEAKIPEGSRLFVREIIEDSKTHNEYLTEAEGKIENISYARFFDISILDKEGNEIEPSSAVDVRIIIDDAPEADDIKAVHFTEEETQVIDTEKNEEEVTFTTESFSVYGVVYTVDFHYEVNGKMYEFSIPGGGFVSLEQIAEALSIYKTGENETAEEEEVKLNEAKVSEAAKTFVADVENVEFSQPDLVWVEKVEEATTVGELKEGLGLEVEYSAELTEEQIAEINQSMVEEGDWALISVRPFDTEEFLTVTMKNGDSFQICVTDAQIKKTVIDAKGDTWEITVTYGEEAQIPEGAELKVSEILPESEEYYEYYRRAADLVCEEEEGNRHGYGRLFDISIWNGEEEIEPQSMVEVSIKLANALEDRDELRVVHFDENAPEVMSLEEMPESAVLSENAVEEEQKETELRFETTSFSLYAVVSTNTTNGSGLGGKKFAIINQNVNEAVLGRTNNSNRIAASSVSRQTINGTNYVIADEVTLWEFVSVGGNVYNLKAPDGRYLNITGRGTATLSTDPMNITVTQNGNGLRLIGTNDFALNAWNSSTADGFGGGKYNNDGERFALYSVNELIQNQADKISLTDLINLHNGETPIEEVVVYTRILNQNRDGYDYYAVGADGSLIKVYDIGDTIGWVSSEATPEYLKWKLTVHSNEGNHNGYFDFQSMDNDLYLIPTEATGLKPDDPDDSWDLGVNMQGWNNGTYGSAIERWDSGNRVYVGYGYDAVNKKIVPTADDSQKLEFLFAHVKEDTASNQLHTVPTLDGKTKGITIKMYDFDGQTLVNGKPPRSYEMSQVIGMNDKSLNSTNINGVGYANRGLVSETLNNEGFPQATQTNRSLSELFNSSNQVSNENKTSNIFVRQVYDETGYFSYDSSKNYAYLSNDGFILYRELAAPEMEGDTTPSANKGNFFPFDSLQDLANRNQVFTNRFVKYDGDLQEMTPDNPQYGDTLYKIAHGNTNNYKSYFFGMTMEAEFYQGPGGKDERGNDIIYEFNGDDDMWLYIDDRLVLDIGGCHGAVSGTINFSTGVVKVNGAKDQVNTTLRDIFYNAGKLPDGTNWTEEGAAKWFKGNTFADYTKHSFKMFYMERGSYASNLKMRFNLLTIEPGSFVLEKKLPDYVQAAYGDQLFAYQIYTVSDNQENLYTPPTGKYVTYEKNGERVVPEGQTESAAFKQSYTVNGQTYQNVYFLKAGESIVIPMANNEVRYYVKEIGIDPLYEEVKANGRELTISKEGDSRVAQTSTDVVKTRGRVTYENIPKEVYNLRLEKIVQGPIGNPDDSFRFDVLLEDSATGRFVPYYMGQYYIVKTINGDDHYYKYENRQLVESNDQVAYVAGINGSIDHILPGYTILITGLLPGTDFKVTENLSGGEFPEGYEYVKTEVENAGGNAESWAKGEGTILASNGKENSDALVKITNKLEGITIQKVNEKDEGLAGAIFQLKSVDGLSESEVTVVDGIGTVTKVIDGQTKIFTSSFETTGEVQTFYGLPDGTYRLYEVYVPDGYINTFGYVEFVVENHRIKNATTQSGDSSKIDTSSTGVDLKITNTPGVALPNTGGSGTRLFTILGSILILGAGVLLWRRRRLI